MTMALGLTYTLGHLKNRKLMIAMTLSGVALVVFVFVVTLMFSNGLEHTLSATGSDDNVVVIRSGAENEIQSGLTYEQISIILSEPEVERDKDGQALASLDTVVVVSLRKRRDNYISNVTLRGMSNLGLAIRPGIQLVEGRLPAKGTREVIVGKAIKEKFKDTEVGQNIRLVGTEWPVVGIFEAGDSGYGSEIWGDVDILRPAFRREMYSSLLFRLKPGAKLAAFRERLSRDPRLNISMQTEPKYYQEQSKMLSTVISVMGIVISVFFSLGAMIGAMITMYSSVANRVHEIGMLRAIGFSRKSIFFSFLFECMLISFLGGIFGVLLASLMSFVSIATTNFQTFAEVAFDFRLNAQIIFLGLLFSVIMGVIGGMFPAIRASRIDVLDAIRE